jgi:hypothetical protein
MGTFRRTREERAEVKKVLIGCAVVVSAIVVLRRFGPVLRQRAMSKCQNMFEHMPEEFPPKRMMRNLEEIRQQSSRILSHLENEETALVAAHVGGDVDDVG